jgi:formate dehydrogenase major subunit
MADVRVTIDGREVFVPPHSTILDAAEAAGVDIPTLCDHPALDPIGACRICLVEVEKQRVLQPACTFPVSDGMVVFTESEKVKASRRFVLQLLFSERNHFCMYCQMSGSCELQRLAYENGLDHWEYDRAFPKMPVDASREYFVMDHNRCILCRRCIRVCDERVGNNTLGLRNRGAETMIIADMDVPFGESSCVSCGSCLQVCPTGALMDRASAFMGADAEVQRVKSRCTACSVGCGVELVVRGNRVIRVEGDWDAEPNHGLLCEIGRFHLLNDRRQPLTKPMVKGEDGLQAASWDEALGQIAAQLKGAGDSLCSVMSGFSTTEAAQALAANLPGLKTQMGAVPVEGTCASLECLDETDLFLVVKADLTVDYQVAGFAIKRGVRHRGARLILVGDEPNGLRPWAYAQHPVSEIDKVVTIAKDAEMPVIICGPAGSEAAQALAAALPKAKLVSFASGGNAVGIAAAGVDTTFAGQKARAYYVLAGELEPAQINGQLLDALKQADFVAVQACFIEPWGEVADVLLPSPNMYEKSGSLTNAAGREAQLVAGKTTRTPSEEQVIAQLAGLMK